MALLVMKCSEVQRAVLSAHWQHPCPCSCTCEGIVPGKKADNGTFLHFTMALFAMAYHEQQ